MKGVVAAGHPLSAEAGARTLREGGNAVDAAVCAVLASFATESPLTGMGAGGFMLVHTPAGEATLIDFFVQAPGLGSVERRIELDPIDVRFDAKTEQRFNAGAASCGVPGTVAGLAHALGRFGSIPLAELIGPAVKIAREGAPLNAQQAFVLEILEPIYGRYEGTRRLYFPEGRCLREGDVFSSPELAEDLERLGSEGPADFYNGETARRIAEFICAEGGIVSPEDLAAYEAVEREPARAHYRGASILTNPPPSSGGILIALCLDLLERLGSSSVSNMVAVMEAANESRGEDFNTGLYTDGYLAKFLDPESSAAAAERIRAGSEGPDPTTPEDNLGSTTHLAVMDSDGMCATVTCSNGTGSGIVVPGTAIHMNNMLGEEDLNPLGFHKTPAGTRMTSMMSPTVVTRDGEILAGLGSAGSNRIRSAVLQTIVRMLDDGLDAQAAIDAPRVHFEAGDLRAEPGVDERALAELETKGVPVTRFEELNLFFGGVQAVTRDPATGELDGGGDPRRGGAVAHA